MIEPRYERSCHCDACDECRVYHLERYRRRWRALAKRLFRYWQSVSGGLARERRVMADEKRSVRLTSSDVACLLAERVAKEAGLALPVKHEARWGMEAGELVVYLTVEPVANVAKLGPAARTTRRWGRSGKAGA